MSDLADKNTGVFVGGYPDIDAATKDFDATPQGRWATNPPPPPDGARAVDYVLSR